MSKLKNILLELEANQRDYDKYYSEHGHKSDDSFINLGWLECARFIDKQFDVQDKTINKGE